MLLWKFLCAKMPNASYYTSMKAQPGNEEAEDETFIFFFSKKFFTTRKTTTIICTYRKKYTLIHSFYTQNIIIKFLLNCLYFSIRHIKFNRKQPISLLLYCILLVPINGIINVSKYRYTISTLYSIL